MLDTREKQDGICFSRSPITDYREKDQSWILDARDWRLVKTAYCILLTAYWLMAK